MSLIVTTSASGAPGVTTTAVGWTLTWPRPLVLVEADMSAGSSILAGYLRGGVDHSRGVVGLALAHRARGRLTLDDLHDQSHELATDRRLIPGISDPRQAPGLTTLWPALADLAASLERDGIDVLVDAGRAGVAYGPHPLLRAADTTVLITRTQLPAIAALKSRIACLGEDLTAAPDLVRLLLIGPGQPYTAREITGALGVPVLAELPFDEAGAAVFTGQTARPGPWYRRSSPLRPALDAARDALLQHVTDRRTRLAPREVRP